MPVDVRFVLAPFLPPRQPALGVSSLAATLEARGYSTEVVYLNLDYLARIGKDAYQLLAKFSQVTLLGEVIFARALWGDDAYGFSEYWDSLDESLAGQSSAVVTSGDWRSARELMGRSRGVLEALYEQSPMLVSAWAERLVDAKPRVLGLSSSFQQNVASLALAQAVRRLDPAREIALALGGANCEGEMGRLLADRFGFLDAVVSGEAEPIIVSLVRRLTADAALDDSGAHAGSTFIEGSYVQAMDDLPIPKFDDFFAQADRAGLNGEIYLTAESARGCWWGAKAHCKFCGLNGDSMAYRAKGGPRVARELRQLRETHGTSRFMMTDNILDMKHFDSLLPDLEDDGLELFYEIKSNLKRIHVERLARAGVRWVQPGVESLDSGVLRLIAKGVSAIQNIQLLKWCKEAGIRPFWSILYGFPGEAPEAMRRMTALLPSLYHLPPPMQLAPFQLHRFSPYFFDAPRYGIEEVRPAWGYRFAYPGLSSEERSRVAYCFEFDCAVTNHDPVSFSQLSAAVSDWMSSAAGGAQLCRLQTDAGSMLYDSRAGEAPRIEPLTDCELNLLDHLSEARGRDQLLEAVAGELEDEVEPALERLIAANYVLEMDGRLLSIVLDYSWTEGWRSAESTSSTWM